MIYTPMPVGIGRNGFAAPHAKREGDHQSPTGFFRLGQLFCYDKTVNTMMPFVQTTSEDNGLTILIHQITICTSGVKLTPNPSKT